MTWTPSPHTARFAERRFRVRDPMFIGRSVKLPGVPGRDRNLAFRRSPSGRGVARRRYRAGDRGGDADLGCRRRLGSAATKQRRRFGPRLAWGTAALLACVGMGVAWWNRADRTGATPPSVAPAIVNNGASAGRPMPNPDAVPPSPRRPRARHSHPVARHGAGASVGGFGADDCGARAGARGVSRRAGKRNVGCQ